MATKEFFNLIKATLDKREQEELCGMLGNNISEDSITPFMDSKEMLKTVIKALTIHDANTTFMDVNQCAEFLGCHRNTVVDRINHKDKNKRISATSVDGKWSIPKRQFLEKVIKQYEES